MSGLAAVGGISGSSPAVSTEGEFVINELWIYLRSADKVLFAAVKTAHRIAEVHDQLLDTFISAAVQQTRITTTNAWNAVTVPLAGTKQYQAGLAILNGSDVFGPIPLVTTLPDPGPLELSNGVELLTTSITYPNPTVAPPADMVGYQVRLSPRRRRWWWPR